MKCVSKKSILSLSLVASLFGSIALDSAQACTQGDDLIGSICVVTYTRGCPSGYVATDGRSLPISAYQALYALIGPTFGGDGKTYFNVPDLRGRVVVGTGAAVSPYTSQVTLGQKRGEESISLNQSQIPAHAHTATFTPTTGPVPVTIPGQAASGAITATASTDVVPGSPSSVDPAPNVHNYYLTGVAGGTIYGPVTTTLPGTDKSTLIGTTVAVDGSAYKSATAAQTVNITNVTGGSVTVASTPNQTTAVSTLPPELGLTYCIATQGMFPTFD